jgi:putative DNA primase/helicase
MDDIDAVLDLAKRGFRVHPLQSRNKIPILAQWKDRATTDETTIRLWASQNKNCNWGIATGRGSGIVVIDVDITHGGDISWKKLLADHEQLNTVSVKTGSGGMHYYFAYPDGNDIGNSPGAVGKGIDIRGNEGQVVAPGSIHPNGNKYEWLNHPDKITLRPMPTWLLDLILDQTSNDYNTIGDTVEKGNRNNSIYHNALALARQGSSKEFAIGAITKWIRDQKQADISQEELLATVESAYKAAEKKHIDLFEKSDSFIAETLIDAYGNDIIYVSGLGWFHWNDKVWEPDLDDAIITQLFIKCMKSMRDDAIQKMAASSSRGDAKELGAIINWSIRSMSATAIHNAIGLASSFTKIRKTPNDIDPLHTQWKLNCNNGTIDLQTGILCEHNKNDMITKIVPINYDPLAKCPFWDSTFELIFDGNRRLIDFMQRAIGYSITGSSDERCFFICWGEAGANGKSTVMETVQNILGVGYAQMSDMVVITSSTVDNRVSSSLAKLQGARFVSMNEAEEHQKLSEALIKQLTGGDTVQACFKYKNPFEYKPVFKLWIRTNEKPIIRSQNNAIWDRVKLIPFERSIPIEQRLPRSDVDAKLAAEQQGILSWIVEGARMWTAKKSLNAPPEVSAAVSEYRTDSDIVKLFMEECCETGNGFKVKSPDVYQAFSGWCKDAGEKWIMTRTKFTQRLAAHSGQQTTRSGGYTYIMGVKLTQQANMYVN